MSELKTLKDLPHYYDREGNKILLFETHIKEEAIKWIIYKSGSNIYEDIEVVKWIKHFFNITSEDLK